MFVPAAIAEHTLESLHAMHGAERPWTYWLVMTGTLGALASLPFIRVDVSVQAPGLLRSVTERAELKAPVAGCISEVLARDNDSVSEGQVLLVIAAGELDERLRRQAAVRAERAACIADLQLLLANADQAGSLQTDPLRLEQLEFQTQLEIRRLAEARAGGEFTRYSTLADKGIATRQELENARYEAVQRRTETRLFLEQARGRWAARLRDEQVAHDDLVSAIRRLEQEKSDHVVRAPVSGVLVGFGGWSAGARVLAGQGLGAVSPGDALRVESQVSTRDIGQVRKGQTVRLQIDAYPYTQWGMLSGEVEAIGGDLSIQQSALSQERYFKVLIRPRATHLILPDGTRGEMKKGLTLTARYVVGRRSLLQALYDDASVRLNPQGPRPRE
jgi:multidrug resistance efflux pump